MFQYVRNRPKLKSLDQRKWFILIFWLLIIGGIISALITFVIFFEDVEAFLAMIFATSSFFYEAYLFYQAFSGFDDWNRFRCAIIDLDELFEVGLMNEGKEKRKRQKQLDIKSKEYNRLWKIYWKLKLLDRKEKLYIKKTEKKCAKFDKKRKKLEKDLIPRCEGIKQNIKY